MLLLELQPAYRLNQIENQIWTELKEVRQDGDQLNLLQVWELKNFLQQFDQLQKLQLRIRWYSIHPRIEPKKARLRELRLE